MPKIQVFESISLDGFFTGAKGDLSWAHRGDDDPEWGKYVSGNAGGGGPILMGRVTFQMMESFWPTPAAAKQMPEVAKGMNESQKVVFSKTLKSTKWQNTVIVPSDLVPEVKKMKQERGPDITILGSGSIVSQLAAAGLIDSYTLVMIPVAIGTGRPLFEDLKKPLPMTLVKSRKFNNGNVVLEYQAA